MQLSPAALVSNRRHPGRLSCPAPLRYDGLLKEGFGVSTIGQIAITLSQPDQAIAFYPEPGRKPVPHSAAPVTGQESLPLHPVQQNRQPGRRFGVTAEA